MIISIPVATEECQRRIAAFASGLSDLCHVHGLEIQISDSNFWLVDSKRAGATNPEWPWVASINLPSMAAELSTIEQHAFPEDYQCLSVAREMGVEW